MSRTSDYDLRRELRKWRSSKTAELGYGEEWRVFRNKVIDGLVQQRPKTRADLLRVDGIGATIADKYGDALLEIVRTGSGDTAPSGQDLALIPPSKSRAGLPWSAKEVASLQSMHAKGESLKMMSLLLGRSNYAVELKLSGMGLTPPPYSNKRNLDGSDAAVPPTPAKRAAR